MKQRILSGWNTRRVFYAAIGTAIVVMSLVQKEWWGALPGAYFALMGLLGFGCAGGNCATGPGRRLAVRKGRDIKS
jgi:hypothetical protein